MEVANVAQNGEKIILLGHSLGGLLCGHYALRYPEQIEKLVLMSSVGVSEMPSHWQPDNLRASCNSSSSLRGAEWVLHTWNNMPFSPADPYRAVGYRLAKKFVYNGLLRRIYAGAWKDDEEKEMFVELFL